MRPPRAFPRARPAMNTDRTMATIAAVTPKRAMARRSQTTWHSSAQNPEMTKKAKNQRSRKESLRGLRPRRAGYTKVSALCEGGSDREQSLRMSDATFADLRAFMGALRRQDDLAVIEAPVDARLEAAEIHRRVIAAGGPALPFANLPRAHLPPL